MAADYVLVIDDDDDMLTLITDALLTLDIESRCARDGHKGLDLIRQQRPSLVILDLVMPLITGWTLHPVMNLMAGSWPSSR